MSPVRFNWDVYIHLYRESQLLDAVCVNLSSSGLISIQKGVQPFSSKVVDDDSGLTRVLIITHRAMFGMMPMIRAVVYLKFPDRDDDIVSIKWNKDESTHDEDYVRQFGFAKKHHPWYLHNCETHQLAMKDEDMLFELICAAFTTYKVINRGKRNHSFMTGRAIVTRTNHCLINELVGTLEARKAMNGLAAWHAPNEDIISYAIQNQKLFSLGKVDTNDYHLADVSYYGWLLFRRESRSNTTNYIAPPLPIIVRPISKTPRLKKQKQIKSSSLSSSTVSEKELTDSQTFVNSIDINCNENEIDY